MAYPIEGNADLVQPEVISAYLRAMFGHVEFENDDLVVFRGIGERGSPSEGLKPVNHAVQPALVPLDEVAIALARRWAQYNYAAYVVPGVTKDPHARADSIRLMTAVMVDLDNGDTVAKFYHAQERMPFPPDFVVESGGFTMGGLPKLHLYWMLKEPSEDIARCMRMRDKLARMLGGDVALGIAEHGAAIGRAHQPIRIPGTVYAKGNSDSTPASRIVKVTIDREGRFHMVH